jgi:hypothetical protein
MSSRAKMGGRGLKPTLARNPINMFLGDLLWITQKLPPGEGIFSYCNDALALL